MMSHKKNPKIPKDLELKMGTKLERFWTEVRNDSKLEIQSHKNSILLQEALLEKADKRILEEQEKFKKS